MVCRVVRRLISCLIKKVISVGTSPRTTLPTRQVTTLDDRSPGFVGEELATPPPADEGEVVGEAAPDPSLPTTGSRGRVQPRNLVQLAEAGGQLGGWSEGTSRGQQFEGKQREESRERKAERGSRERKQREEAERGSRERKRKKGGAVGAGCSQDGAVKVQSRRCSQDIAHVDAMLGLTLRAAAPCS